MCCSVDCATGGPLSADHGKASRERTIGCEGHAMRVGGDAAAAWSGDQGMRATVSL